MSAAQLGHDLAHKLQAAWRTPPSVVDSLLASPLPGRVWPEEDKGEVELLLMLISHICGMLHIRVLTRMCMQVVVSKSANGSAVCSAASDPLHMASVAGVRPKAWFRPDQKLAGSNASNMSNAVGGGNILITISLSGSVTCATMLHALWLTAAALV